MKRSTEPRGTFVRPSRIRSVAIGLWVVGGVACATEPPDPAKDVELTVLEVTLDTDIFTQNLPPPGGTYWASLVVQVRNDFSGEVSLSFAGFRVTGDAGLSHDAAVESEFLDDGCRVGLHVTPGAVGSCRLAVALAYDELPLSVAYQPVVDGSEVTADIQICSADAPDLCGYECVDLATDVDNCGVCSRGVDNACVDGMIECGELTACGDTCIDTETDPANCGGCGQLVPENAHCDDGEVVCDDGYDKCDDGQCHDLSSENENCGACGVPVASDEASCTDGMPVCVDPTESLCADDCTDLSADRYNCGGCGLECPLPENPAVTTTFACGTGETCAIMFPNPGGNCEERCALNDWTCDYDPGGGYCICDSEYSAGECQCRCSADVVGP